MRGRGSSPVSHGVGQAQRVSRRPEFSLCSVPAAHGYPAPDSVRPAAAGCVSIPTSTPPGGQRHRPDQAEQRESTPPKQPKRVVVEPEQQVGVVGYHQYQCHGFYQVSLPRRPDQQPLQPVVRDHLQGEENVILCPHLSLRSVFFPGRGHAPPRAPSVAGVHVAHSRAPPVSPRHRGGAPHDCPVP